MFTYGLLITIGSLAFTILLALVYFHKKRFSLVRNKLYLLLLIAIIAFQISEIVAIVLLKYLNNDILTFVSWRLHWVIGIIIFGLLYLYCSTYIKNIRFNTINELINSNQRLKLIFALIIISIFIYLLIPFDGLDINALTFIPGIATYFVGTVFIIIVILIVYNLLKFNKNTSEKISSSVWLMILITIIMVVFQLMFPHVSFIPFGFALEALFLYFIVENPDLETINELQKLKEEVDKSGKAKLDFLFNMSHDIRSPMNAIVSLSSMLSKIKNFDEISVRKDIENIKLSGNNLVDIINDILDISKIETGEYGLQEREYSIVSLVKDLPTIISSRIGSKPITFKINIDKNISSVLYGDATKIYQIMMNILTNSAKYTEVGRITLNITSTKYRDSETLHFKMSDTGYGIKKEDTEKLFQKFNRLSDATDNGIEGTGLGLVITKKFVDILGGKIWFESEYEVGTIFYVDINQKIINSSTIGETNILEEKKKTSEVLDCSTKRVLIVDDNKLNVKVACRLLQKYKCKIDYVYSGKDCVYNIKKGEKYDLIFMDHMMPEMDGLRALHIIKKLDGYIIPPVVALTANAMNGVREMYLKEGFSDYISKPIDVRELDRVINKFLKNK